MKSQLASLHDHFNQGQLSSEAFFQLIKGNLKAFKMEEKRLAGKSLVRKSALIENDH